MNEVYMKKTPILEVRHASISFSQYHGLVAKRDLRVISDLSVDLFEGEMVAVVGASGSGKSLLAHAVMGILPDNASLSGELMYCGERLTPERTRLLRGKEIVLVPQSVAYLDPLMKVGPQLRKGARDAESRLKASGLLGRYGLSPDVERKYPFELSGGMARRVLISTAVMERPRLVIADEPTPGLNASVARRVLAHFREIADDGAAVLLITHDLELAAEAADRVVVFYAGTTIEEARASDFESESKLRHPYTKALWRAMPANGFEAIQGAQPYASDVPSGCSFRLSCERATKRCSGEIPYRELDGGYVRCV